jgi:hypothetical protein
MTENDLKRASAGQLAKLLWLGQGWNDMEKRWALSRALELIDDLEKRVQKLERASPR